MSGRREWRVEKIANFLWFWLVLVDKQYIHTTILNPRNNNVNLQYSGNPACKVTKLTQLIQQLIIIWDVVIYLQRMELVCKSGGLLLSTPDLKESAFYIFNEFRFIYLSGGGYNKGTTGTKKRSKTQKIINAIESKKQCCWSNYFHHSIKPHHPHVPP